MGKEVALLVLVILGALAIATSVSRNPVIRMTGVIVFGLLSVATTALTVLLVQVGVKNHWSSDGPGMLLIMIGIGIFGFVSYLGWSFVLRTLFGRERP